MQRRSLRCIPRISYSEVEEPNLDEYVFCDKCADFVYEYCSIHGPLLVIPDDKVPAKSPSPALVPRAALTVPREFLHLARSVIPGAGVGVFSTLTLPSGVRFGPYRGRHTTQIDSPYCWQIRDSNNRWSHAVDASDANASNWMRYVNCARHWHEQNLVAYQYQGQIYYRTIKIVPRFSELLVFYGGSFAAALRLDLAAYNAPRDYAAKYVGGAPTAKKLKTADKSKKKQEEQSPPKQNEAGERNSTNTVTKKKENTQQHDDSKENVKPNFTKKSEVLKNNDQNNNKMLNVKPLNPSSTSNCDTTQNNNKYFICDTCGLRFKCKNTLTFHIKTHNETYNNEKNVSEVQLCVKTSCKRGQKNIKSSLRNNTNMKLSCNYCRKEFAYKSKLTSHVRTHTGEKPYSCSHCGQKFTQKPHLTRHIRIHTGEKPFSCISCGQKFTQNSDLITHKRIHTGEKPFSCSSCGKKFRRKSHLIKHKRIHTGEKPLSCSNCGKKYSDRRSLNKHIKSHTS